MINAVLYNIVGLFPLSFNNLVSETVYPERTHPNLKYFVPYEPFVKKDYDSRLEDYQKIETPIDTPHPNYSIYGQWLIEHNYIKRSQSDVFLSIENARRLANSTLIDNDKYAMGIGIIAKKLTNGILTPEENQILADIVLIHVRVMQNYTNESTLKTAWLDDQPINIDEGWEKN